MNFEKFNMIKNMYGFHASWAIWAETGERPKSNIGDLSVFDINQNEMLLDQLKPTIILVGLNISRGLIKEPFANFHDRSPHGTDFKIRYALKGTPYWGAYMTDFFKDLKEQDSKKVKALIKKEPKLVEHHAQYLREEIETVTGNSNLRATIVAFGNIVYENLLEHFSDKHEIKKVPHYASQNFNNKDRYREAVARSLDFDL